MAKPKLMQMSIRPAKNGGHNVRHEYQSTPRLAKGSLTGGMTMGQPPAEEFNFGPKDHKALMSHIAGALALKGIAAPGPAPAQNPGGGGNPEL